MKLAHRILLFASFLLIVQFAAAQVPQFTPFSADMQITSTGARGPADMNGKLYVGSGHMRMDMEMQGQQSAVITDFATQTVDILMIQPKMYMEHNMGQMQRRGPGSTTADLHPYDPENPCASQPDITCKKIGEEVVSGRTCEHWEITDKNGRVSNVWIDPKLHFPVKATTQDGSILLSNIKEGQPDAGLFQIPAGFTKMDMGGMMGPGMGRPPQN